MGRNTAACIGLAAALISKKDPDGIMVIVPSDHIIKKKGTFERDVSNSIKFVQNKGVLLTIGIRPLYPSTGFGYMKRGARIDGSIYRVDAFIEKPDIRTS